MMKKAFYFIGTIVEILLLAGIFIIHYFTQRKMGMARYVIYKNQGWNRKYPIELLSNLTSLILIGLTVIVLALLIKRIQRISKFVVLMSAIMVILVASYLIFTRVYSVEVMRDYYFISAFLALVSFIQIIKTFVNLIMNRSKKNK
ncbi:MAG: hypothetical protein KH355_04855 [Clostridiales bacterium]|nr:hypothetical protein [Clostridiales bacterium]